MKKARTMSIPIKSIPVEPISGAAFAPFGTIIRHVDGVAIADAGSAFVHDPAAHQPVMEWVHLSEKVTLPLSVKRLEHHPFSAQTFLPHSSCPFLVVVCPSLPDGAPDPAGARAFEVPAMLGVTFNAKVWHRSLAPLVAPSAFVMAMMRTGRNDDTVFEDLGSALLIG